MAKDYTVQFNMIDNSEDGEAIIPVITKVYTSVPYWGDISEEQREDEVKDFAVSQLEDVGIALDENKIRSVLIKEII